MSNLSYYLVPHMEEPNDLLAVLRRMETDGKRPRKYVQYPELGCELGTKEAITWAKGSAVKALTVANSRSTQAETLKELSKFTQKTVKRAVAAHENADAETCQRLVKWAVKNDNDIELLSNMSMTHHPEKWVEALLEQRLQTWPDRDPNAWLWGMQGDVLKCMHYVKENDLDAESTISLLKYLDSHFKYEDAARFAEFVGISIVADRPVRRDADYTETVLLGMFAGDSELLVRATNQALNSLSSSGENEVQRFSDEFVNTLITAVREVASKRSTTVDDLYNQSAEYAYNRLHSDSKDNWLRVREGNTSMLKVSSTALRALLRECNQWSNAVAVQAYASSNEDWTDAEVNELARSHPNWFVHYLLNEDSYQRLSKDTVSYLVMRASVASWEASTGQWQRGRNNSSTFHKEIIKTYDAGTSLALTMKMAPGTLIDVLHEGSVPTWEASELLNLSEENTQLADPSTMYGRRSGFTQGRFVEVEQGKVLVNSLWAQRAGITAEMDKIEWGIPQSIVSRSLPNGEAAREWTYNLMNSFGKVTCARVANMGDPDYRGLYDPWVDGFHHWLSKSLTGDPDGWVTALGLLDNWSGTLEDLGETVKALSVVSV